MPSKNQHPADSPQTRNQNNAMSGDPADKPGSVGKTAIEKPAAGDPRAQPTPEEFGKRGMGIAAKE